MVRCYRPAASIAGAALALATVAHAAPLDRPVLASEVQGYAKVVVIVVAGPSGAPAGFTMQWMRFSDFLANGGQFYAESNPVQSEGSFTGEPTLNTWDGLLTSFVLAPSASAAIEIGDLYDETGVTRNAAADLELSERTLYIFRARANGDGEWEPSEWSNVFVIESGTNVNCTLTQGFWKNHPASWPVTSLTLGTVTYTQTQLLAILNQPARGNGLVILAHQLIATLLNAAMGANTSAVAAQIAAAHALVGGLVVPPVGTGYLHPSSTSSLTQALDDYNNGITGPGHCGPTAVDASTWARVKSIYR